MAEDSRNQEVSKPVVMLTVGQLQALLDQQREELLADVRGLVTGAVAAPLDRKGAAEFLRISMQQLDKLCRERALPHYRCGDSKRFIRDELISWLRGEAPQ